MIKLSKLSCNEGDGKIEIDDDDPKKRAEFSEEILKLLKKGAFIVVKASDGKKHRVVGYDAANNEWVTQEAGGRTKKVKITAARTQATVVAPIAGG